MGSRQRSQGPAIMGPAMMGPAINPALAASVGGMDGAPSKAEQRRVAALNFAISGRGPDGYTDHRDLLAAAKAIDAFIDTGAVPDAGD